ncbi:rod shape-determining protein RodA (plasmid) [Bernardetia sp. Wsw4-3y2]|uniref:rod shape-determining protein RodA n=1 Tax=unclassified Bernardetia TaxID=2647129 RepID=UPI0030D46431
MYGSSSSSRSPFSQLDWMTILLFFGLLTWGWISIYAAIYDAEKTYTITQFLFKTNAGKQIVWIGLATMLALVLMLLDVRLFASVSPFFYIGTMALLVGVLLFGREVAGSKSWFDFGGIRFQPAELAKVGTALMIAFFLGNKRVSAEKWKYIGVLMVIIGIPAVLTILQGDTGSAMVFASFFIVFYREGLPSFIMVAGLSAILLLVATLVMLSDLWGLMQRIIVIGGTVLLCIQLIDFFRRRAEDRPKWFVFAIEIGLNVILLTIPWWLPVQEYQSEDIALIKSESFKQNLMWLSGVFAVWLFIKGIFSITIDKKYKPIWLVGFIVIAAVAIVGGLDFFVKDVLKEYQRKRLEVLVDPTQGKQDFGWQVYNSKSAISSGGLTGKGFLEGTHTKLNYVPDQSTDFIYCTIGEEQGWVGSFGVLVLFVLLFFRLIHVAERQKSKFSRVYAYGVVSILFYHFVVNIGMTIGLFPVIGIPLPFFSYGGSSLWGFTLLLFILVKLDMHRKIEVKID